MKKESIIRKVLIVLVVLVVFQFGVKPLFTDDDRNAGWAGGKLVKEQDIYDVIVAGEESEGIAAAVSAARSGARTLLLAQGESLGGIISRSLIGDMEVNYGLDGKLLNKGIFSDLYNKLGKNFTIDGYIAAVNVMTKGERNLEIVYGAEVDTTVLEDNVLAGLNVEVNGEKRLYKGKRFIDATRDGDILSLCGVPYFTGSEDLNMKKSFMPPRLNFEVYGIDRERIEKLISSKGSNLSWLLEGYEPSNIHISIKNLKFYYQGENKAIVQGIELNSLDISDKKLLAEAYRDAENEAKSLTVFLKNKIRLFENLQFIRIADEFYLRERIHYQGEYMLKVSDILQNRDFDDKIVLASYPIEAAKFADGAPYIIGRPVQYSIPLGCIIPVNVENLLMIGSKASYSSLAASSAGTFSVNIAMGEAAGVAAVYSIIEGISPRELVNSKDTQGIQKLQELLREQGMYLPDFEFPNPNASHWAYSSLQDLCTLGLVAGGYGNNYKLDTEATSKDLAILLINGIYRLSPDKYSLDLDLRLKPYYGSEKLTRDMAAQMLLTLHGSKVKQKEAYKLVCEKGYIDNAMQQRLKDDRVLKMEDVFYLAAGNIKKFTGKEIED